MIILFEYEHNGMRTTEVLVGCVQYILEVPYLGNAFHYNPIPSCEIRHDWSMYEHVHSNATAGTE